MCDSPEKEVKAFMEEKNTTNPSEKNESKKQSKKQEKKNEKSSFSETFKDYKAEFQKIIWPNREEVTKKTVTVIITSLLVGVVIFCMDTVYTAGYDVILNLFVK